MQQLVEDGIAEIQTLSKPKRYAMIGALWLFAVIVVSFVNGLVAAVVATTVAVSFIYLIEPFRNRHPDKGIIDLLTSLVDVRRPTLYEHALAVIGVGVVILSEVAFALVLGLLEARDPAGHGVASTANSSPGLLVLVGLFLSAAVVAPIMEELVFRNGLQKLLAFRVGDIAAIIVTSTLFAVLHIPAYGGIDVGLASLALPLSVVFSGSVVFGTLYWRTRNVAVPMISHGLFNGIALLYTVFSPPVFG